MKDGSGYMYVMMAGPGGWLVGWVGHIEAAVCSSNAVVAE